MSELRDWTLVNVPFEGGAPTPGARAGGGAILKYLKSVRPHTHDRFLKVGDLDRDRWHHADRQTVINGFTGLTNTLRGGVVALGGCHTLTYYAVQALRRWYPELALVIFDAHSDASRTRGEFVSHGNFVRNLHRRHPLPIISVGVRGDEAKLEDLSAAILPAVEIEMPAAEDWLSERLEELGDKPVYLTIDVDVLDPAICPGVNHPIGGGLSGDELEALVRTVCRHGVVGVDLVEYVPHRDPEGLGLPTIANLLESIANDPFSVRKTEASRIVSAKAEAATTDHQQSVEHLMKIGYRLPPDEIKSQQRLVNDGRATVLAEYARRVSLSVVGFSDYLTNPDRNEVAVTGGPCLYMTAGSVTRVTLRELLDLVSPIALAAHLRCPCIVYFELEEAHLMASDTASLSPAMYAGMVHVLQATALSYANRQGLSSADLTFAVTTTPEVSAVLSDAVLRHGNTVPDDDLDGIYSIDGRSLFPRHDNLAREFRQLWRRSLVSYMPDIVSRLCDRRVRTVIAAENLDQSRIIRLADELARASSSPGMVGHVAHFSAPSLSGFPMQRSAEHDRLYAWPAVHAIQALSSAPREVADFYHWAWPDTRFTADDFNRESILSVLAIYADAIRQMESTELIAPPINPPASL